MLSGALNHNKQPCLDAHLDWMVSLLSIWHWQLFTVQLHLADLHPQSCALYDLSIFNKNLFKFLGMVVNVWLMCQDASSPKECLLALGDNTSAIGWFYQLGQVDMDSTYYEALQITACKLAGIIINSQHCLASQHIQGMWLTYVPRAQHTHTCIQTTHLTRN
jgi:hypothetical protein